ncbi:MAG: bifunctional oligoribonuclease/PAP phosphatase NrnA [Acidobacteria bacterium]|nr:MAG: bifunctional oligoribonuclease/PAP phosphatase NrnA [Acidobacteriota bacterium]
MSASDVPEAVVRRIQSGDRFLLTSHVHPDGDALGSELALARLLHAVGKGATIWNRDAAPSIYRPLPGSDRIHVGETPPHGFPEHYSGVVVLECPSLERCGLEEAIAGLPIINVDHHLGNTCYGKVNWIDTAAPAVGAMVYRLGRALGAEVDADAATLLYLTLVTDTGGFRFSNATAEAFATAAELVRAGARPERVSLWLYESQPPAVMRLLGELLATLELHHDGRIATVWLTREMFERCGAQDSDSEGLIDYPRSIAGVEAVALFRQVGERAFKVSLRSRGAVDVERIARRFGGGGHKNAAGFRLEGERQELVGITLDALREALEQATCPPK